MAINGEDDMTVLAKVVRIETLLETEFRSINKSLEHHDKVLADHENRLRLMERWRYALPITAIAAVASAGAAVITALGR